MRRALGVGALLLCIGSVPAAHAQTHSIGGRIVIEHRSRHDSIWVWVDSLHSAVTDSLGSYVIGGVEDGEYLVQARAPQCLYRIVDTVRVSGGDVVGIDDTLLAADPVADGRINLLDVGKILLHYNAAEGEAPWDETLDIDGSGRIDSLDLALLMQHWKETGDDPPASRIAVTVPNAETVWYRGKLGTAAWNTGTLGGNVSISLYRGLVWISTIAALTENDGSHAGFLLPRSLAVGSDYRVRVSRDASDVDYSDAFRIDAQIEVLEPTWSTVWLLGQETVEVLWDTADLGSAVAIILHKGESAVDTIARSTSNDGSFAEYDVSDRLTPGTDYRVQVVYDEARSAFGDSFEVKREIEPIIVLEPNRSTRWVHEQQNVPIVWETGHLGGNVSIFLWKGPSIQGCLPADTIALSTPNDGSYEEYDITQRTIYVGTDYRVQVVFDKDHTGLSDFFEIELALAPAIGVTEPNAGTVWTLGQENVPIFWNGGPAGGMSIDLYEGGVFAASIAGAAPNSGSFGDYDVPAGLAPGTQYRVRVSFAGGHVEESAEFEIRASEETGWSFLYPFPQGNGLGGVAFVNASVGTTVGNSGTIMRTTDGGASWTMQWSGSRNSLYGVAFTDASTGIAVGARGTILRTMDGGAMWSPVRSGTSTTLNAVTFTSTMTATIVGDDGVVLQSADGGITWTGHTPAANYIYGHAIDLKAVSFSDPRYGMAVGGSATSWSDGERVILRTNNGGVSWALQGIDAACYQCDIPTGVALSDSNTAVVVSYCLTQPGGSSCLSGHISRTSNGGATWSRVWSRAAPAAVSYLGDDRFVAVGSGVTSSTDGGASWSEPTSLGSGLRAVSHANTMIGMVVGDHGAIFRTVNYGASWVSQTQSVTSHSLNRLSFPNATSGFAASQLGLILRTRDAGATWVKQQSDTGVDLFDVSFVSDSVGMAAGCTVMFDALPVWYRGDVVGTTNGGAAWNTKLSRSELFYGISLIDAQTATAVGWNGLILRTTDGGTTWVDQTIGPTSLTLFRVFFSDANTGTVVGGAGTILRTTDGGANWVPQTSGTTAYLTDLFFTDASTGTVIGRGGQILRTTDGGATWAGQKSGTTADLSGVFFSDALVGTIVGQGGLILRTTDGGENWVRQPSPVGSDLRDVWFFDSITGIAVGDGGVMLKTTTGGE